MTRTKDVPAPPEQPYRKPPITEAVIGIQFAESLDEAQMAHLNSAFARHYAGEQAFKRVGFQLDLDEAGTPGPPRLDDQGKTFRRMSDDSTQIILLAPDSLTVSVLAPYPGWPSFFSRFQRDWRLLKKQTGYRKLLRIGVRYINRIDIPAPPHLPVIDYERYIAISPQTPDAFGPTVTYSMQTMFKLEKLGCLMVVNTGAVPAPLLETLSFLLDFDIYMDTTAEAITKGRQIPQRDKDIFSLLDEIRLEKNYIFESCITDAARALFEPWPQSES